MNLTKTEYETLKSMGLSAQYRGDDNNPLPPFSEACFNDNAMDEIVDFQTAEPDQIDIENWSLTIDEWRNCQRMTLELAMYWYEDDQ